MPAFNEGAGIRAAIDEVRKALLNKTSGAELIVVDDGSTDDTAALVRAEVMSDSRIRLISQHNQGHGAALNAGVAASSAGVIMVVDADQPIALGQMQPWLERVVSGDVGAVMAHRQRRNDGAGRAVLSFGLSCALFMRFGRWVGDANVPCKILPRGAWVPSAAVPSAITAIRLQAVRVPVKMRDTGAGASGRVLWRTALGALRAIYS
ncbi:dolichol-phosphate mannosyltransferase- membrane bound sugar transferase involved in LPS biosynthesis [Ketogulonicigenium robustum]|uniref:Dolichol-phosphate mannosyltransferase-membrane bound sugar transferase involved in LPS biosynthesis n=2 Tax=Ketogulonicigenium robustum TaxID=92947 RepID=A0A1W6NYJ5_9RHOB|nr:dolichol-phosphate mannosyltransferase- membrane bound sugar transferase involved in LPS biosynthesis [Ketogulonicigenium robustum]